MTAIVLLVFLVSSSFAYLHHTSNQSCMKWCYSKDVYNKVFFSCCDYIERAGVCDKSCSFIGNWDLRNIGCYNDLNCPHGHKCCEDDCNPYKICKPVVYYEVGNSGGKEPKPETPKEAEKPVTPEEPKNEIDPTYDKDYPGLETLT